MQVNPEDSPPDIYVTWSKRKRKESKESSWLSSKYMPYQKGWTHCSISSDTHQVHVVEIKKKLLLRCLHYFKSDLINDMDHMCTRWCTRCYYIIFDGSFRHKRLLKRLDKATTGQRSKQMFVSTSQAARALQNWSLKIKQREHQWNRYSSATFFTQWNVLAYTFWENYKWLRQLIYIALPFLDHAK